MEDVVVTENVLNKPMYNNPRYVPGEISAPDSHYVPALYSHYIATKNFNQINQDIYEAQKDAKPADRKKTPKGILVLLGAGLTYGLVKLIQHLIKLKK